MSSLDRYAAAKLAEMESAHRRRRLVESARDDGIHITRQGRQLVSFSCNDYLNLTHHPAVKEAAIKAVEKYGVGAGASRLVTGNHPLLIELEQRLAHYKGLEAACVFGSGYLANTGIIPSLMGKEDLLLVDELAHGCLWAGSMLTNGKLVMFRHNDMDLLRQLLEQHRASHPYALIVTDGVFSMDGDLAPLPEMVAIAAEFDAWLMTDDAHGLGILNGGRGSAFHKGEKLPIPLQMGTLSKALASYGGYICAAQNVIDLIKTRARTLIYSTGLPPASAAAAIAALDVIEQNPGLGQQALEKAQSFTRALNIPLATSTIVPVIIGPEAVSLDASKILEQEGFIVTAIRPPTVPKGTARLRFAFSAGHADADIQRVASIVRDKIMPLIG